MEPKTYDEVLQDVLEAYGCPTKDFQRYEAIAEDIYYAQFDKENSNA